MDIKIEHLVKRYGARFTLDIPRLDIGPGETFGLVGNNGAGKTTFLRLLLDLIPADEGRVLLDGRSVSRSETWKASTGAYLDASFLLDFLAPDEYLSFCGLTYGLNKQQVQEAVALYRPFLTDSVLDDRRRYIRDLSTGNAKKVGIAAAMLAGPKLLVLDEPFANLDPASQIRLKNLLVHLNETYCTTMVISSHDLDHVTDICGRIAILEDGRVVRQTQTSDGTLEELEAYFAAQTHRDLALRPKPSDARPA